MIWKEVMHGWKESGQEGAGHRRLNSNARREDGQTH